MWTCESNPKIGTPESRLIETVEPLWKTADHYKPQTLPAPLQRLHTHLHHRIKNILQFPMSWWKVAPIFTFPLSVFHISHVLLVCNRLLKNKNHHWISQKFSVQYAPVLCVLACVNGNRTAAHKYLKHIPEDIYPKMLSVLCELTDPTPEIKEIAQHLVQKMSQDNSFAPFYRFLTNCLKNNTDLLEMVVNHLEISTFDWRCALQLVGETFSEERRHSAIDKFVTAVHIQSQKSDNFLYALDCEMKSLKYHHTSLPTGWKEIIQNTHPILHHFKKEYWSRKNSHCDAISTLKNTNNLAVMEGVVRFIRSSESDSEILRILMENDLLNAAELFVKTCGHIDICENLYVSNPNYPHLCALSLKGKISEHLSQPHYSRTRKL